MSEETKERGAPELAGHVISGRYRVLAHIGRGALGDVYLVEHLNVGRRFALKLLRPEHRGSEAIRRRFRQEARLGVQLEAAYTAPVFDYDTWQGAPYIVMEYLDGSSLRALLDREGELPVLRAASLLVQACRGVASAHALGVLHRDLKPSNLFVCRREGGELCKILDFGIAKLEGRAAGSSSSPTTSTGAVIGTLAYMAPEQIRGTHDLDARADVYALGAILYECLAGVPAFAAPTPPALMYKILEEGPAPLDTLRPGLPGEIVAVVERALERDREARFQSAHELERALAPFSQRAPERASVSALDGTQASYVDGAGGSALALGAARGPTWSVTVAAALVAAATGLGAGLALEGERRGDVTALQPTLCASVPSDQSARALPHGPALEQGVVAPERVAPARAAASGAAPPGATAPRHEPPSAAKQAASGPGPGGRSPTRRAEAAPLGRTEPIEPAPTPPGPAGDTVPGVEFERVNPYREAS